MLEVWGHDTRTPVLGEIRDGLKPICCCLITFMEGRRPGLLAPESQFPKAPMRVPAPTCPALRQTGPEPCALMVCISKCGHSGVLCEAKDTAPREERLKSTSLDPGPCFLSIFSFDELFRWSSLHRRQRKGLLHTLLATFPHHIIIITTRKQHF